MARAEKELVDYQAQADRPFEYEGRLKLLLARQSELNSQLDLDKGDQQGADSPPEGGEDFDRGKAAAIAAQIQLKWQSWPRHTCARQEGRFEKSLSFSERRRQQV